MTAILIRCDASLSIGSGHVMRCRTLARELQRRGAAVTFLCRRQAGDLIVLLEQEFAVLPLPELPLLATAGLAGRALYQAWLGCSQEQDAADSLQALDGCTGHADWPSLTTTVWMPVGTPAVGGQAGEATPNC